MARMSHDSGLTSVFSVVAVCVMLWAAATEGRLQAARVHQHLKRLNKPAVKSIESPDGDIIDCVHIFKQPAFDHPLLKNHTIQFKPTYYPEGLYDDAKSSMGEKPMLQLWHQKGSCPEGTVPIRRTKKDDLLRASSMWQYGRKWHPTPKQLSRSGHEHQYAYVYTNVVDKYYGGKANINVWKPEVQVPIEFSLSQMWIVDGSYQDGDLNTIEAGWQVYPKKYGDNNTRLFIYWTRDAYKSTGCYNLLCPGFIQLTNKYAIGSTLSPTSEYGGRQYELNILIWKDPKTGNWWMKINDYVVGYWPSSLFSKLADSASSIKWGGEIVNSKPNGMQTSTHMGSGDFAAAGYEYASYYRNIQVVNSNNQLSAPKVTDRASKPDCYTVESHSNDIWGTYFFYGGPGKNGQACF